MRYHHPFYERPKSDQKRLGTFSFLPVFAGTQLFIHPTSTLSTAATSQTNNVPLEMANLIYLK
jgi:hypothetical protein